MKLPHVNFTKLWAALGVVASLVASPAVTGVLSAKTAAIVAAALYLLKTITGNPPPAPPAAGK